ncbi:hypothetical protein CEXT_486041, partial [Caerostris extrusa]
ADIDDDKVTPLAESNSN